MIILLIWTLSLICRGTIRMSAPYFRSLKIPWILEPILIELTNEARPIMIKKAKGISMGLGPVFFIPPDNCLARKVKARNPINIFTAAEEKLATNGIAIISQ